jgi:DNA repair exonuclease SbcCD nuclease subunit
MPVTFLHTADWQIGKPFAPFDDPQKRAVVQSERVNVLERIAAVARAENAEFILVSGDVFDSPSATKSTVSAASSAIGKMNLPEFVIPGNHDCASPGSVWEQPFFEREHKALAPNLTLLLEATPREFDSVVLFPCPAVRRHEVMDTTAWLRSLAPSLDDFGEKPRVVLAHGSVHGFDVEPDDEESPGGARNQIDLSRLPENAFDYFALGDWHGTKEVGRAAWYSGTPEPDRFSRGGSNVPGHVLSVVASRNEPPVVRMMRTARIGWHRIDFEFSDDVDVARLETSLDALIGARAQQDALFLELRGTLGLDARTRLEQKLEAWEARLLRLRLADRTTIAPTREELEALTGRISDPLIARVAEKLVARSELESEEAEVARCALRELHAACRAI